VRDDAVMTPDRWSTIEVLFARAVDLEPKERAAFLGESTGGDIDLRRAVEDLLVQHDRDPAFLEDPPPWLAPGPDVDPLPERIGDYSILRALGRGGMGQVYLAERVAHDFRQQVALKVLRRGLDTDDLLRRFRAERQILATLDHPNIARLLDVGATDEGLPYFVMEYIEGTTILEHCDGRRLTVRQRLALFRTVCSAVQHAHRSLVAHRDLKPGNVVVTDAGVPKLLDFGIAKILDPEHEASHAAATRAGERLLTPEYAAPEQLRGEAVTTACDVYALGVLLYELLAGRHPYAGAAGRDDLERRILRSDPAPPSAVVRDDASPGELGATRSSSPEALRRALVGDLDTIVAKAMRKEPGARYVSASSLSADVRRYLEGLPVDARPATVVYKLRKFVGRHRVAVAAGTGAILLLTAFSGVTAYQSARIREESSRVARERDKALEVRRFLLETFGARGPDQAAGDSVTVRKVLDRRAATLADAYADDPELHAELALVLAEAYEKLGLYPAAEPLARRALDERRRLHGPEHADVASALNALGWIQRQRGDLEQAEATLREAVRAGRAVFPPEGDDRLARALNDLGVVHQARGDYDDAETAYGESLDMRRRLSGESSIGIFVTMSNLAAVLYGRGDLEGAATMTEHAAAGFGRLLGDDHERSVIAQGNLAAIRAAQGDHERAAAAYAELVQRNRRLFGARHPQLSYALMAHANELVQLGRHDEAEPLLRESLDIARESFGPRHERVAHTLRVRGDAAHGGGRHEAAVANYTEALEILASALGPQHREVADLRLYRSRAYEALGQVREAEADFRASIAAFRGALGTDHHLTAGATLELVELLVRTDRMEEALQLLDELGPVVAGLGPTFPTLADRLATARRRADRVDGSAPATP